MSQILKKTVRLVLLGAVLLGCFTCASVSPGKEPSEPGDETGTIIQENLGKIYHLPLGTFDEVIPEFKDDDGGNKTFGYGDEMRLAYGLDAMAFSLGSETIPFFKAQVDAARQANCTAISVPLVWATIERQKDEYDYVNLDKGFEYAIDAGLKLIPYWHGSNFAAIDSRFTPRYILADKAKYQRIVGNPDGTMGNGIKNDSMLCPLNAATLTREQAAYVKTVQHIRDSIYARHVLALIVGAETNYLGAFGEFGSSDLLPPQRDIRCHCPACEVQFAQRNSEGRYDGSVFPNVDYMTEIFAEYIGSMYNAGAQEWDIPTMAQVAPKSQMVHQTWRYAENPEVLARKITNPNFFPVPTVTEEFRHLQAVVDLGTQYEIAKYVITHNGSTQTNTSDFAILTSLDGENWTFADIVLNNSANVSTYFIDATARYVMLYISKSKVETGWHDARVREIEIYEKQQ